MHLDIDFYRNFHLRYFPSVKINRISSFENSINRTNHTEINHAIAICTIKKKYANDRRRVTQGVFQYVEAGSRSARRPMWHLK